MAPAGPPLGPAAPDDRADATLRLPALRRRGPGLMAHAMRGLVVTPWFAAATGLVVAAGLWVYWPHAELRFPPSAAGGVPCQSQGCGITAGKGSGALATTKGQQIAPPKSTRMSAAQPYLDGGTAVAGLTFGYRVIWRSQSEFGVLISVTGKDVAHTWKLRFAMKGDKISEIMGAAWHQYGTAGGTASGPAGVAPGEWQGPAQGGNSDSATSYGNDAPDGISFLVVAAGTPVAPTACFFNGARCEFS